MGAEQWQFFRKQEHEYQLQPDIVGNRVSLIYDAAGQNWLEKHKPKFMDGFGDFPDHERVVDTALHLMEYGHREGIEVILPSGTGPYILSEQASLHAPLWEYEIVDLKSVNPNDVKARINIHSAILARNGENIYPIGKLSIIFQGTSDLEDLDQVYFQPHSLLVELDYVPSATESIPRHRTSGTTRCLVSFDYAETSFSAKIVRGDKTSYGVRVEFAPKISRDS